MKITFHKLLLILFVLLIFLGCGQSTDFFTKADSFMVSYVDHGLVDYEAIKTNKEDIKDLVNDIAAFDTENAEENTLKAFYINAYNLLVIQQIIEHYPISSPMDIDGFYDKTTFALANQKITLDQLENELIRKELKDPRVHFALVCGAQGCSPLPSFAFMPNNVEQLLTEQTTTILNDESFVNIDTQNKTVSVSEIFKWYNEDFTKDGATIIGYINSYRDEKIPIDYSVEYYPYNWKTNAR